MINKAFFEESYCILDAPIDEYTATEQEQKQGLEKYDTYFELYDDDDILYFKGRYDSNEIYEVYEQGEFAILDRYMAEYGCTYMKERNNKSGKMNVI